MRGAIAIIRIDAAWLATAPLNMCAGTDTAQARVITLFGEAHPHYVYLFTNKFANRIKVLAHVGIGTWMAAHRPHHGKTVWPAPVDVNSRHRLAVGARPVRCPERHW